MNPSRLSVLMSVHNGGRWLRPAIDSVLAQTWHDFELLVIDDASTDDTVAQIEALRDSRIRLIRLPENVGLTRSLNAGLHAARGEFIARHDADDLSTRDRFDRQIAFLDTNPKVPLVGAQARLIDAEGRSRGVRDLPCSPVAIRWLSLFDNPIIHTAAMFRTQVIREEFGGYDESFPSCQDYDLWARIMVKYPVANLANRLVAVREHGSSISATRRAEAGGLVRRVVRRLADKWLPSLALTEGEIDLLCSYRRHLSPEEIPPFRDLLARCDDAFATTFPESVSSEELALTRAGLFARIGYNVLTKNRALGLRQFADAVRESPAVVRRIPWSRVAALFVLGERARKLAGR